MQLSSVDFPDPDCPMRATISPAWTSNVTFLNSHAFLLFFPVFPFMAIVLPKVETLNMVDSRLPIVLPYCAWTPILQGTTPENNYFLNILWTRE